MDYKTMALEKIRSKAYYLGVFQPDEEVAREAKDIFWLAVAGLEGREKASALDTFTEMSGIPTDDRERRLTPAVPDVAGHCPECGSDVEIMGHAQNCPYF